MLFVVGSVTIVRIHVFRSYAVDGRADLYRWMGSHSALAPFTRYFCVPFWHGACARGQMPNVRQERGELHVSPPAQAPQS